jgi:hypothetical protein
MRYQILAAPPIRRGGHCDDSDPPIAHTHEVAAGEGGQAGKLDLTPAAKLPTVQEADCDPPHLRTRLRRFG